MCTIIITKGFQSILETAKKDFIKWPPISHWLLCNFLTQKHWFRSPPHPYVLASPTLGLFLFLQTLLFPQCVKQARNRIAASGEQGAEPISLLRHANSPSGSAFQPPRQLHQYQVGRSHLRNSQQISRACRNLESKSSTLSLPPARATMVIGKESCFAPQIWDH